MEIVEESKFCLLYNFDYEHELYGVIDVEVVKGHYKEDIISVWALYTRDGEESECVISIPERLKPTKEDIIKKINDYIFYS